VPVVERTALVNYSAQQMFDLVNDIEAYPDYMDGCVGAQILQRENDWLEARLDLAKGGIRQSFTTRNQLLPPHTMTLSLREGPFAYLEGKWQFTALNEQACKVSFALDFELQNPLLGMVLSKLFESMVNKQVEALCARAKTIYVGEK
jgi:ribosome-associated toxin RatA of RatAB toxin-antitoxin module